MRYFHISLVFFSLAVGFLGGCQTTVDDQYLIRQRLQQMAAAVEARQVRDFLQRFHRDFQGQQGMRRANLQGLLLLQFRRHLAIHVRLSDIHIQLQGERATVTLRARLSGQGGWLGRGRVLDIESRWLKSDGQWWVERARW